MDTMQMPSLDDLVTRAREHKMTASERRAQRVSMVMGLRSHHSTLTRETVEEFLGEIKGHDGQSDQSHSTKSAA